MVINKKRSKDCSLLPFDNKLRGKIMRIGIDLGGSHIGIGLINNGEIIRKNEYNFSKEDKENLEEVINKIIGQEIDDILQILDVEQIEMIGISAPRKT